MTITLRVRSADVDLKYLTDAQGTFKFGPIDSSSNDYELAAEKESYVFAAFDKTENVFRAHKLCEIFVTVKDDQRQPLAGVLLSLSGGEGYRKNLISGADGVIHFHSLSPSEYFLKPILKEYKFEPHSKLVPIADGETVHVELRARRVAYSVFGTVTSLSGDSFPGVILEAVSEQCNFHHEESTSEASGGFRIRGLNPGCEYSIRTRKSTDGAVDRTIPLERIVQLGTSDVDSVNFIAISGRIGFVDVAARVKATTIEHYKTLRISLYRKGSNDNPVYNGRLEQPLNTKSRTNPGVMVFFPRIPFDETKTYVIELSTTLATGSFKYDLEQFEFLANQSSVYHEFVFAPEARAAEAELNQNSIAALVLLCVVAFAFLKQELFLELVVMAYSKVSGAVTELVEKNKRQKDSRDDAAVLNDRDLDSLARSINEVRKKKQPKKTQ